MSARALSVARARLASRQAAWASGESNAIVSLLSVRVLAVYLSIGVDFDPCSFILGHLSQASSRSANPTASSLSAMVLLHWRSRSRQAIVLSVDVMVSYVYGVFDRTYISPVLETLRQQGQKGLTVTDVEVFVRDHCVVDVLPAVCACIFEWTNGVWRSNFYPHQKYLQ